MANKRHQKKALAKKVESLEDQLFGQKLLVDELESRIELLTQKIEKLENPFQVTYPNLNVPAHNNRIGIGSSSPKIPMVVTTTTTDPCIDPNTNTFVPNHTYTQDSFGNFSCSTCGKTMSGGVWGVSRSYNSSDIVLTNTSSDASNKIDMVGLAEQLKQQGY